MVFIEFTAISLIAVCLFIRYNQTRTSKLCFKCIRTERVLRSTDVRAGDHITIRRDNRVLTYHHHALITEVHHSIEGELKVNIIHVQSDKYILIPFAVVKEDCETFTLDEKYVYVLKYCGNAHAFPYQERINRAKSASKMHRYDLFLNNCEHFVSKCVTGYDESFQIEKLKISCSSSEKNGRLTEMFKKNLICCDCYIKELRFLGADFTRVIYDDEDYKVGDIITYCFDKYDKYHQGIIVDKHPRDMSRCTIIHYDTKREEIVKDQFRIRFGKTEVTTYDESKLFVNSIEETCKRAVSRLGEKSYKAYENDSNTFARWCKLADYQPYHIEDIINLYFILPIRKLFVLLCKFMNTLFSKPNTETAQRTKHYLINGENDYRIGDVIIIPESDTLIDCIVVEKIAGGRCGLVYIDRKKTVVKYEKTIKFGLTEVSEFDESTFFLNPPEVVRRRATSQIGKRVEDHALGDFIRNCKLQDDQPRYILVVCVRVVVMIGKVINYIHKLQGLKGVILITLLFLIVLIFM